MKFRNQLVLSLLFVALLHRPAMANLIVNGGFENAPLAGGNNPKGVDFGGTVYYASSVPVSINGWTFGYDGTLDNYGGIAEVEWYSNTQKRSWNQLPASGSYALELNSDAFRGRIYAQASLAAPLTVGATYTLSFSLAPELGVSNPGTVSALVTVDGASYAFAVSALSQWNAESLTFVASSAAPLIRFYDGAYVPDVNTNFYNDINIDNVTLLPPQAPEPSALCALIALGTAAAGQWGWRKLQSRSSAG